MTDIPQILIDNTDTRWDEIVSGFATNAQTEFEKDVVADVKDAGELTTDDVYLLCDTNQDGVLGFEDDGVLSNVKRLSLFVPNIENQLFEEFKDKIINAPLWEKLDAIRQTRFLPQDLAIEFLYVVPRFSLEQKVLDLAFKELERLGETNILGKKDWSTIHYRPKQDDVTEEVFRELGLAGQKNYLVDGYRHTPEFYQILKSLVLREGDWVYKAFRFFGIDSDQYRMNDEDHQSPEFRKAVHEAFSGHALFDARLEVKDLYSKGHRDFRWFDLSGADLSYLDLSGCDFSEADWREAYVEHTNLTGTKIMSIQMRGVYFGEREFLYDSISALMCHSPEDWALISQIEEETGWQFATKESMFALLDYLKESGGRLTKENVYHISKTIVRIYETNPSLDKHYLYSAFHNSKNNSSVLVAAFALIYLGEEESIAEEFEVYLANSLYSFESDDIEFYRNQIKYDRLYQDKLQAGEIDVVTYDPELNSKCPEGMSYIPGRRFLMGGPDGIEKQNWAIKTVESYCLDQTEVTNAQYEKITGKTTPSIEGYDDPNQPVMYVEYHDANQACESQGKSLPTEEQWENAAKGPTGAFAYPSEDGRAPNETNMNWANDTVDSEGTSPVAIYPVGPFGLYDMAGNVCEWAKINKSNGDASLGLETYIQVKNRFKSSRNIISIYSVLYILKLTRTKIITKKHIDKAFLEILNKFKNNFISPGFNIIIKPGEQVIS